MALNAPAEVRKPGMFSVKALALIEVSLNRVPGDV
jgi:hypothetical protein